MGGVRAARVVVPRGTDRAGAGQPRASGHRDRRWRARETFRALGLGFVPATGRDAVGEIGAGDPDLGARRAWHRAYVQGWFADVTGALAAQRYDVVLADPLEPGAAFAAEVAGVPYVSYAHWAMDQTGPDLFFATHLWDGVADAADAFVEFWNDQRAAVGLLPDPRPADQHRWYRHSTQLALVLGLPELVHPRGELPPYARRIGPSVWAPPRTRALPPELQVHDPNQDLILVSLSTVGSADQQLLATIANAVREDGCDVLVTLPNGTTPADLPQDVVVTPFLSHDADLIARVDCGDGAAAVDGQPSAGCCASVGCGDRRSGGDPPVRGTARRGPDLGRRVPGKEG